MLTVSIRDCHGERASAVLHSVVITRGRLLPTWQSRCRGTLGVCGLPRLRLAMTGFWEPLR